MQTGRTSKCCDSKLFRTWLNDVGSNTTQVVGNGVIAQQFKRARHLGIREETQNQRINPERFGPPLPRHTFAALKKTCRKLGVSFWDYLGHRMAGANSIPWLPHLMEQRPSPKVSALLLRGYLLPNGYQREVVL